MQNDEKSDARMSIKQSISGNEGEAEGPKARGSRTVRIASDDVSKARGSKTVRIASDDSSQS